MATFRGIGCTWAVGTTTCTAFGTFKLQERDHSYKAEMEAIKDGNGETVGKVYYDFTEEANFTYVPSATSSGSNTPTLPTIGSLVTVGETVYTQLSGSNWIVEDVSTKSSNTNAMKATVKLWRSANITT